MPPLLARVKLCCDYLLAALTLSVLGIAGGIPTHRICLYETQESPSTNK